MNNLKNTLIQITQDGMGSGDPKLGQILVSNYLNLIAKEPELPRFVAFYNAGVKLICKDSPALEVLKELEAKGVKLIACKTCLNHFELMDKQETGIAGTMIDILELQKAAEKVINL